MAAGAEVSRGPRASAIVSPRRPSGAATVSARTPGAGPSTVTDHCRGILTSAKEKGIDKAILISALENAMISAAKKTFGHQRKIEAQFNAEIGEVELFEAKTVVETVQDSATEITRDDARENLDPDANGLTRGVRALEEGVDHALHHPRHRVEVV